MRRFGCVLFFAAIFVPGTAMGTEEGSPEVLMTHRFRVIFHQTPEIPVVEIRGLSSETMYPSRKLKPVDFVIVRPMQSPDALWEWRAAVMERKDDKRSGLIEILKPDGTPVISLFIRDAWPIKWVWPTLNAEDPKPAKEEIHFRAAEVRLLTDASKKPVEDRKVSPVKKKVQDPFNEMDKQIQGDLQRKKEDQN